MKLYLCQSSATYTGCTIHVHVMLSLWLWLYGSWIYNYLCNQFLSPLKLRVWTPYMADCTRYNIMR